ncbi:hypothetical protein NGF19_25855 [Streptomyces sp. RY43-2]|uniref:Uncharacterized protein n=1 Tax=Streptomyces macrolidinus TaxID=2952607 RepID=A0ABT0ZKP3_9ACTN|nr:hypothetical protein [Streptomyces macrolidinus]MCN9244164.1 hypothetical protein [Streptomyces macrolidinus]
MSEQQTPERETEPAEVTPEVPAPPAAASEIPPPPVAPEVPAASAAKSRRRLWSVLRWTAAVLVFAATGAATAYGVTGMERDDVPGLATRSDGRWEYPQIVRPPLPAGRPGPTADRNPALVHYADLRKLVLPAPKGAKADPKLVGDHGWVKPEVYLAEYASETDRDMLKTVLVDAGLRHIAARGWTMPDGTRTRIYLLQLENGRAADGLQRSEFSGFNEPPHLLRGSPATKMDQSFPESASKGVVLSTYVETKPYGAEQVRHAYLTSGDVIALIVQSRKGGAEQIPFQQTVVLQRQLLD